MATFQDIRQFLEHYHNDLTLTLEPSEQTQFQTAFGRLQRDWDAIPDESVKLNVNRIHEQDDRPANVLLRIAERSCRRLARCA